MIKIGDEVDYNFGYDMGEFLYRCKGIVRRILDIDEEVHQCYCLVKLNRCDLEMTDGDIAVGAGLPEVIHRHQWIDYI